MLQNIKSSRGGFTLVEIMIVVAIIALLASIAIPSLMRARSRTQATQCKQDLRMIDMAMDQYAIENNKKQEILHPHGLISRNISKKTAVWARLLLPPIPLAVRLPFLLSAETWPCRQPPTRRFRIQLPPISGRPTR